MLRHVFCAAVLAVTSFTAAAMDVGIFPRGSVAETHKAFKPLADYLSAQMGEPVNLNVPKDFSEFWKQVEQKKFDLVHFNQYHYIKSHKEFGYEVIVAIEEFGDRQIAGMLSVRGDSGIQSLADLRGKTILFGGGVTAMGSYIAPLALLRQAGLEPDKDFKVAFSKNPPGAVIGVFNKAADAAGAGNVMLRLKAVTDQIDVAQMKVLSESESFVQLPWAVKGDMPQTMKKKLQDTLSGLKQKPEGKAILDAAKVTDFFPISDQDFAKVREITKFALKEEY